MTPEACKKTIFQKRRDIEQIHVEISKIAKEHIPDFHWMNHMVSTFWECEQSPIGVCVFDLDDHGDPEYCRYCSGPVVRK